MDIYYNLLEKPVFDVKYLLKYYNHEDAARSALKRLLRSGQVFKIRNNMYTCSSGKNGGPVANRFQIASAVTESSFVSHHSAMEYYGVSDQVFYEVYVGSMAQFLSFEFDGYTYRYVSSIFGDGIYNPEFSGGISVTDRERTVIDCIRDMDHIAGVEEVISDIQSLKILDEKKLLHYLNLYDSQFLYQKAGYMLQREQKTFDISDEFLKKCHDKIHKSKRYLTMDHADNVVYDKRWQLVVPENLYNMKNGIGIEDANI